ncbi:MAG: LexA family protein [Anaerolineae bacterium]
MRELTPRQQEFLDQVIDLYQTTGEPVHYSTVAERLGVSNSTAYEMLRVLERKTHLSARYVLAESSGPGRSTVMFTPRSQLADAEWEQVRSRILATLGRDEASNQELLQDILGQLPDISSPLAYCAQVTTALLLSVRTELRSRLSEHELIQAILASNLPDTPSLNLLPGFALGLSFRERANRELRSRLVEHTQEYQRRLGRLDARGRSMLRDFLRRVVVQTQTTTPEG